MKTVAELTGFSPTLLRAWERRYTFLDPDRLEKGHRLYTESDLKILDVVRVLLDQGFSVGEVAAIGREALLARGVKVAAVTQAGRLAEPSSSPYTLEEARPEKSHLEDDIERSRHDGLASCSLSNLAGDRFCGIGLGVSLKEVGPPDLSRICSLYALVESCYSVWLYMDEVKDHSVLTQRLSLLVKPEFLEEVEKIGSSTKNPSPLVRAALDDSRTGAMTPLIRLTRDFLSRPVQMDDLKLAVLLARDHAKMMRNAFYDLDTSLREADESLKAHRLGPIAKKFAKLGGKRVKVGWNGPISSRCLETSTIDRIQYDYVRRIQATGASHFELTVYPINHHLIRWVFEFERSQERQFSVPSDQELASIAVSQACGVSAKQALDQKYLGYTADGEICSAWFHWPVYQAPPGLKICDCELH
jgi:DNA-binding transcriptional MerR regulator